jgi:hypothetical protein
LNSEWNVQLNNLLRYFDLIADNEMAVEYLCIFLIYAIILSDLATFI